MKEQMFWSHVLLWTLSVLPAVDYLILLKQIFILSGLVS